MKTTHLQPLQITEVNMILVVVL